MKQLIVVEDWAILNNQTSYISVFKVSLHDFFEAG